MSEREELWIPLVDEPIGGIVEQIQREHPDIAALVESPHRVLAFRTFAYIRVGLVLGQLLFDNDLPPYDGSETWVDQLLQEPGAPRGTRAGGARGRRGDRRRPEVRRRGDDRAGRRDARALPRVRARSSSAARRPG